MPAAGYRFLDKVPTTMSRRLEKLKRVEEAKAPKDRLVNRDWDDKVQKKIGILNTVRQRWALQVSV